MIFNIEIFKDSIIKPITDQMQVIYGNANVDNEGVITIYNNTKIRYEYDFDYVNSLKTSQLILGYTIRNKLGINLLFDHNILSINLYIKFFKKTDDDTLSNEDGNIVNVKCIPTVIPENYIMISHMHKVDIDDWYVKKLIIDIEFRGTLGDLYEIRGLTLKRLKTVSEEVKSTIKWSPVADSITVRPNGYEIMLDGNESMTLLVDIETINGVNKLKQVIINSTRDDERIIPVNYSSEPIPKNIV